MIVIPAILVAIAGAAFIGGIAGAVICGMEDKRNLDVDAPKELRTAHRCAAEGALVSGTISLAFPFFGVFDDLGKPIAGLGDEALGIVDDAIGFVDDAAKSASNGARQVAKSLTRHMNAPLKLETNLSRASYFRWLPKLKGRAGYVYVIDDVADGTRKIGMTKNPAQRLARLRSELGRELKYVCIIVTDHVRLLEHALHSAFAAQRLPNTGAGTEWFRLSRIQLAAACSQ